MTVTIKPIIPNHQAQTRPNVSNGTPEPICST